MCQISIIVPIYNVEDYLCFAVDSILTQSFTDFELLLINDGSLDYSAEICDAYALKDKRVRVFHKKNSGVSSARNLGLDNARGKYIIFLDADDYWYDNTALEQLYTLSEKYDLDIIRGEYKAVDHGGNDLFENPLPKYKIELSNIILTPGVFYTRIMHGENFLVLSLFKRQAIGNIRFDKKRVFLEDMEFYVRLLCQPLRCMFVPIRFYAYRKHSSSASNSYKIQNLIDSFSMCDIFNECFSKVNDEILKSAYKYNSIMMYYWTLETISLDPYYKNRSTIIKELSLLSRQRQVSEWAKKGHSVFPIMIYLHPCLGIFIFRCLNICKLLFVFMKKRIRSLLGKYLG